MVSKLPKYSRILMAVKAAKIKAVVNKMPFKS
jgi:hypothetical protein